jgi:hypothetical protein
VDQSRSFQHLSLTAWILNQILILIQNMCSGMENHRYSMSQIGSMVLNMSYHWQLPEQGQSKSQMQRWSQIAWIQSRCFEIQKMNHKCSKNQTGLMKLNWQGRTGENQSMLLDFQKRIRKCSRSQTVQREQSRSC